MPSSESYDHHKTNDNFSYHQNDYLIIKKSPRVHSGTFCCFSPQMEFFLQS